MVPASSTLHHEPERVLLGEEITATSVKELEESLSAAIEGGAHNLVLDFDRVRFVDSVGLSLLISAHSVLKERGGKLRGINVSDDLLRLFTSMRLDRHFELSPREGSGA